MLLSIHRDKGETVENITDCAVVVIKDYANNVMATIEGGLVVLDEPHQVKELFKGHWEVVL